MHAWKQNVTSRNRNRKGRFSFRVLRWLQCKRNTRVYRTVQSSPTQSLGSSVDGKTCHEGRCVFFFFFLRQKRLAASPRRVRVLYPSTTSRRDVPRRSRRGSCLYIIFASSQKNVLETFHTPKKVSLDLPPAPRVKRERRGAGQSKCPTVGADGHTLIWSYAHMVVWSYGRMTYGSYIRVSPSS